MTGKTHRLCVHAPVGFKTQAVLSRIRSEMYNDHWNLRFCTLLASFLLAVSGAELSAKGFDLVVYWATPSGVATAVNAGREGLSVALVEETCQVGGMTAAGLAHSDFHTFQSLRSKATQDQRRPGLFACSLVWLRWPLADEPAAAIC